MFAKLSYTFISSSARGPLVDINRSFVTILRKYVLVFRSFYWGQSFSSDSFSSRKVRSPSQRCCAYYAALLPRRGPHIASHSVRLSVCLSVCPSVPLSLPSVTWRHLANYNDTHVLFGTHWRHQYFSARTEGRAYRTAISAAQILVYFETFVEEFLHSYS